MKKLLLALVLLVPAPLWGQTQLLVDCWPLQLKGTIKLVPSNISTRYDAVGIWSCETPTGIRNYHLFFSWANAKSVATKEGPWTKAEADAVYSPLAKALTPEEMAWGDATAAPYVAKAYVASNGILKTRKVFTLNPDGTRSAAPVAGQEVAVAAECNAGVRVANTSFYSVKGRTNADPSGPPILGDVVAVCQVVAPLGLNRN